ncbi:MAG: M23 family metallopeptidase [Clostridia bacterium]|nr:M23 family metallopeptidase [Clostridia bacterium]
MIIPFRCNSVRVTSPFGERTLSGEKNWHSGYDMVGVGSCFVTAAVGGVVVQSRIVTDKSNATWQWGNYVCIKTDAGQYHYYCHLASRTVAKGQYVRAGDKLGVMGNTGYSFGAHLHFEVRAADGKTLICPESVLGIPNQTGTYQVSSLTADLQVLLARGVLNSPAYWEKTAPTVRYLPELLHNVAEVLR